VFERLVEQSQALTPLLEARLAHIRADYAAHGLTPVHTYAWREGTTRHPARRARLGAHQHFQFDDATTQRLVDFHRFKGWLSGAWLGAAALTVIEG
jgi:hypothetical protein